MGRTSRRSLHAIMSFALDVRVSLPSVHELPRGEDYGTSKEGGKRSKYFFVKSGKAQAAAGGPLISKSGYDLTEMPLNEVEKIAQKFPGTARRVLLQAGTEIPFTGSTVNGYSGDTKNEGVWVSAVSEVPLFSSDAKFNSGTGWPSFFQPYDPDHIIERIDPRDVESNKPKFLQRVEVLDRKSGTHLGHVFNDGPKPTGKRYCMNAAALKFIPKKEFEKLEQKRKAKL